MKERPEPPSNVIQFPSQEKELREKRDARAIAILKSPRNDVADSAHVHTYGEYIPKFSTNDLATIIDEHYANPGRFHPLYIRTVAEEYSIRRGIELPEESVIATHESAGFHRKGLPNAKLENLSELERDRGDLSELREAVLETFFHLENHVARNPELGIRSAEVNDIMDKYLRIFERDGTKSLRAELVAALENSEREQWGNREEIEKYLGLFHAYLSVMGDDEA